MFLWQTHFYYSLVIHFLELPQSLLSLKTANEMYLCVQYSITLLIVCPKHSSKYLVCIALKNNVIIFCCQRQ